MEYQINLNEEHMQSLILACETLLRVSMAQFNYAIDMGFNVPDDRMEEVRKACDILKEACGLSPSQNYSAHSSQVKESAKVAHDIYEVLRHRLSWDRKPQGGFGVYYDTPFLISLQPPVKVKRIDSNMTLDGFCKDKPTEDGLYEVRFADAKNTSLNRIEIKTIDGVQFAFNHDIDTKAKLTSIEDEKYQWKKL